MNRDKTNQLRTGRDLYRAMFGTPPLAHVLRERHRSENLSKLGEAYRVGFRLRRGCQVTRRAFTAGLTTGGRP